MWYKQLSAFWLPSPPSAALLEAASLAVATQIIMADNLTALLGELAELAGGLKV